MIGVESGFKKMRLFAVEQATSRVYGAQQKCMEGMEIISQTLEFQQVLKGYSPRLERDGNEFPDEAATPRKKTRCWTRKGGVERAFDGSIAAIILPRERQRCSAESWSDSSVIHTQATNILVQPGVGDLDVTFKYPFPE